MGGPGQNPPLLILGVGDEGQGRAILCWGNPDTARNVSTIVPGLNSTLAGAGGGDTMSAKGIYDAAEDSQVKNHETPSTASMIWLRYDAPQADGISVTSKDRAVAGAASYDQFLTGLRTTHQGPDPAHVTAIGHSYGTLLVGQAAQRPGGLAANDIVLAGSPGVGAANASQLGIGADHVYVGSAMWDPVTRSPSGADAASTGIAADLDAVLGGPAAAQVGGYLGHQVDPHGLWYGKDPASTDFGGQRFHVADGSVTDSHDNYFDDRKGGDSLSNIGKIVGGHPDQITREAGR